MALSPPAGYTSSDLVFQDDFSGTTLDSIWHPYITSNAANGAPWNSNGAGGSGGGNALDVEYDMPSQVTVSNGTLNITATQKSVVGDVRGSAVTFPVTSGAVSSYGNFEFTGGYLQISMKAPSGDGAWPGLWLLPGKGAGGSGDNFEIDMQEGGYTGSGPVNQAFAAHLHTPSGTFGSQVNSGIDLTAGFNTYGIDWVPGKSITWYLNGKQMAQVTSAQMPIPTEPMELIIDSQVANSNAAGWHTVFDSSSPASTLMQIADVQLYQSPGSGDHVTGANVSATTPPVTTPPVTTPPVTTPPAVQPAVTNATASPGTGVEHVGDTVALTLGFNEAVTVTGKPTLTLNDGSTATYVSGSGTNALVFDTTVASTNTATSALAVTAANLASGASIKDASGLSANLSGAAKTFSGLQIDPTPVTTPPVTTPPVTTPPVITPPVTTPPAVQPAVTNATASPGSGVEHVGDTVALTLSFNEAVTVTGKPTLTLNDGSTATYLSGSGTNALVFDTTVASTDTATSALAVTAANLASGASIKDASGLSANLSGAAKTFSGLQIDPTPVTTPPVTTPPVTTPPVITPPVTTPPAIQPAVIWGTASPGSGVEHVGDTVALTFGFNEAVIVTGTPTAKLNDGGTATYVSGSGTNKLVFDTTVTSTDTATSALTATAAPLPSGVSIKDASGVSANLSGTATFSGLQIDPTPVTTPPVTTPPVASGPTAPVLSVADPSLSVHGDGGTVDLGLSVKSSDPDDAVSVNITGLPRYETITDNLDHRTFWGKDITLTAAEVDSGLTLRSNYWGGGQPVATLAVTATATDPTTGAVTTSAAQTITVTDPPPARTATQPAVIWATASPGTGVEHVGDTIALTFGFNEAVTVTGRPTATLNDGGTATYVSGSGTNRLVFDTTVASTDTATSALAVKAASLPSGVSIKDASGVSANLSGTATFSGLQIDPTPVTTPPVTTPPVITPPVTTPPVASSSSSSAPALSVANPSLSVHGGGGTVDLGLSVKSSDPDDAVSVNIKGLPRYETITDNLDHRTFWGKDITLTAAEVDSGLTLRSNYWGSGQPVATLAATATATDPTTGAVTTSAAHTITVTDPPPARTATTREDHSFALLNQYLAGGGLHGQVDRGQVAVNASQATTWLNESLLTRPQH
jgi:beta-glucanase (GH16 family)